MCVQVLSTLFYLEQEPKCPAEKLHSAWCGCPDIKFLHMISILAVGMKQDFMHICIEIEYIRQKQTLYNSKELESQYLL